MPREWRRGILYGMPPAGLARWTLTGLFLWAGPARGAELPALAAAAALEPVPPVVSAEPVAEPERLTLGGTLVPAGGSTGERGAPALQIELGELFNTHWKGAASAAAEGQTLHISVAFDLSGQAYLSILAESWSVPRFFKLARGLSGEFDLGASRYSVGLEVSLFRSRTSNYIVVRKDGRDEPVYRDRIKRLLEQAYLTGKPASVGGRSYRVFFSYDIDASAKPPRLDESRFGLVFVYDSGDRDDHDFHSFIVPFADLGAESIGRYALYEDQPVGLRLSTDKATLEIYDLSVP